MKLESLGAGLFILVCLLTVAGYDALTIIAAFFLALWGYGSRAVRRREDRQKRNRA